MPVENGKTYKIVNLKAGSVLDLHRPTYTTIIGYEWHTGDNQKWIVEIHDNKWFLKNKERQTYLCVVPSLMEGYANGFPVIGTFNQPFAWEAEHVPQYGDAYRLRLPGTTFNVDLSSHGDTANNTPVTLWGASEGQNQIWRFEEETC